MGIGELTRSVYRIVFLLLIILLTSCGGGADPIQDPLPTPTPSSNTSLVGVWLDDCTIDSSGAQTIARQFYIKFNNDGTFETELREVDGMVCGRAANQSTIVGTYTIGADVALSSGNTAKQIERIHTDSIDNGVTTPLGRSFFVRSIVYVDGDTSWWKFSAQDDVSYPVDIDFNAPLNFYRQP